MLVLVTLRLLCVQYNKNYEHESSILTTYVGLARSAKSQKLLMPNSFFFDKLGIGVFLHSWLK